MKRLSLVCLAGLFFLNIHSQAPIVLQDGETSFAHSNIDTIMAHASDGSSIYLPGGNLVLKQEWEIDKKLYIYGAGHYPDSSKATSPTFVTNSNIRFIEGSTGSTLTGIYLQLDVYFGGTASDCIQYVDLSRCSLNRLYLGYISSAHNTPNSYFRFSENVFRSNINGSEAQYCLFENNIIDGQCSNFVNNCSFINNIFNYSYNYNDVFASSSGIIVNNNIFSRDNHGLSSSQINNNIFAVNISGVPGGNNIGNGNIGNQTADSVFNDFDGVSFTYAADLSLKEGSPAIGGGTDGTDIGISGGVNPYKASAVPVNPHIRSINIAKETQNGSLHVEITAVAQEN